MTSRTDGARTRRARLVGSRTGVLADLVVAVVRGTAVVSGVLARAVGRIGSVVTPLGWVMAAVVPLALVAGYLLGWLELVVVGWAGLVLAVIAALYLIGRSPFDVELDLPRRRVVAGEEATGRVTLTNPTRRRLLGVKVEIPVGPGLAEVALPSLRAGASSSQEFVVPTRRRGLIPVGPVRTVRADPVGLVRRELEWTERTELVVHPRTISVPTTSTGLIRDLEGAPTRDLTSSDVAFHALREYQPGDERRYIHWKSTAKTGRLMVREFEQTRRSHLVVALSLATTDYASEEQFELAVSVAGSLGVRAIRDGRTVSVVVSTETPEYARRRVYAVRELATHRPGRLLDDLAVVEASPATLGIRDVARIAADGTAGISVAFLLCGSLTTVAELRAAANAFPLDVAVVAVVCDPDAVPGMRQIGGLSALTIGYLEDLRIALARSAAVA